VPSIKSTCEPRHNIRKEKLQSIILLVFHKCYQSKHREETIIDNLLATPYIFL
jgi:hypothetical protein